jgi:hypothetical protein
LTFTAVIATGRSAEARDADVKQAPLRTDLAPLVNDQVLPLLRAADL